MLDSAGVKVDGNNPWDIKIHDERFITECWPAFIRPWRVLYGRLVGLPELDEFFYRIQRFQIDNQVNRVCHCCLKLCLQVD